MTPPFPQQESQVLTKVKKPLCDLASVAAVSLTPTILPSFIQLRSYWPCALNTPGTLPSASMLRLVPGCSSTWNIIPPGVILAYFSSSFILLYKYHLLNENYLEYCNLLCCSILALLISFTRTVDGTEQALKYIC